MRVVFALLFLAMLILFAFLSDVSAQENSESLTLYTKRSPATFNYTFAVRGELARQVVKRKWVRIKSLTYLSLGAEQKTYRAGGALGRSGYISEDVRIFPGNQGHLFLNIGLKAGMVRYPDYVSKVPGFTFSENKYTKFSYNARFGIGAEIDNKYGYTTVHVVYNVADPYKFDTVNGKRVGNDTRGVEIGSDGCYKVNGKFCMGYSVYYERLSTQQPYRPELPRITGNLFFIGLKLGIIHD